jgi:hypothetical protein
VWGQGGEMTQALYAPINNKRKKINFLLIFVIILMQYNYYFLFYFIIFTFTYMCIYYLGHLPSSHLWAEPVPPSFSLILLKKKYKVKKKDIAFLLVLDGVSYTE